eukprot:TRINITY_DN6137_c0_g1_i20.p1 TRINITY_DN6137_c0_g1~~TRINITY_DN6137_c0_g1_i20.p1  ORF type:complete len:259 (-),score=38.06 TRINITY_DN6137_c0_g1_i20:385-1161(-)
MVQLILCNNFGLNLTPRRSQQARRMLRRAVKQDQKSKSGQSFMPPPAPPAPPVEPPPPPPPPVLPPQTQQDGNAFPTRRDLFLMFMVGGGVWWWRLNQEFPGQIMKLKDQDNVMIYKTPKGAMVAVWEDQAGRFQMLDQAGNFYYDSGDDYIGMVMMDNEGTLTNMYIDEKTKEYQESVIGNIRDIKLELIDRVGNLEFEEPVYVAGFKDKKVPVLDPRGPLPTMITRDQLEVLQEAQEEFKEAREEFRESRKQSNEQ